ncbi:MAG: hypothetical protein KA795_06280 [Burkholderiaceae bacterium]|nr:hypothetical protein [Burkholderiaceae bacterium]
MQTRKLAVVIALSTLSAGVFAAAGQPDDALVRAGTVQPMPQTLSSYAPTRAEVQSQASASIPLSRDSIVAAGLRARPMPSMSTLDRESVRAQAAQANRAAYSVDARLTEGS